MSLSHDIQVNIFDRLFGLPPQNPLREPKEKYRYYQCFKKTDSDNYECEKINGRGESAQAICKYSPESLDTTILSHRLKASVVLKTK